MLRLVSVLFVLWSSFLLAQDLTWEARSSMPNTGRQHHVAFQLNGKLYVGLGLSYTGSYLKDFWEYDPDTDMWTQKANYPGNGSQLCTYFSINNKGYVGLGRNSSGSTFTDFYEYNPTSNSWTQKSNFPGSSRYGGGTFVIDSNGYIGGGTCGGSSCIYQDFWMYSPYSNSWTQKANFIGGTSYYFTGFSLNGFGFFGNRTASSHAPDNSFYRYNPSSNNWTQVASMPSSARRLTSAFTLNSEAYVGLGSNSGSPISSRLNDFYKYTPSTNSWTYLASNDNMVPRVDSRIVDIGDSLVYLIMGSSSNGLEADLWQLKLNSDTCDFYDTTFVTINDTVNYAVFDTTYVTIEDTLVVYDTITIQKYDTTKVQVYDTLTVTRFDTTYIQINDTVSVTVYDTIFQVKIDTQYQTIYDTTYITSYDTVKVIQYISVDDTLDIWVYGYGGCGDIQLQLYPNPSREFVFLYTNKLHCLQGTKVELIDQLGQVLETQNYDQSRITFDIRGYARALYYVRLINSNGETIFSKKLVIQ